LVGGVLTLILLLLPRTADAFALVLIDQNMSQSLAITCSTAVALETIGQNNPLAATTFACLNAAYNFPIAYMPIVDGWGYNHGGVRETFIADGSVGIAACLLMGLLIFLSRDSWRERETERVSDGLAEGDKLFQSNLQSSSVTLDQHFKQSPGHGKPDDLVIG
jgi:MFS transporter, PAT family, beta-lactamase induction signal transducer AmpG